ncbi:MAG TPA: PF20097 family protein [Thermoplasmata archaeon]|nr:PF20097 family protein [Thermoplasmata archaeon]
MAPPALSKCARCGNPLEPGFLSTTNGSGIYWSKQSSSSRLRPNGLEVVVPTGFMGTYSANLAADRCQHCGTFTARLPNR